jgi:hypothetical protein
MIVAEEAKTALSPPADPISHAAMRAVLIAVAKGLASVVRSRAALQIEVRLNPRR